MIKIIYDEGGTVPCLIPSWIRCCWWRRRSDEDNVRNNPDQIPNRKAADIVENSGLDYTVLRPGYLRDGDKDDFTLTFKGEQAKGYVSTIPSVVGLAVRLIHDDTLYVRQSVSITRDMSDTEKL